MPNLPAGDSLDTPAGIKNDRSTPPASPTFSNYHHFPLQNSDSRLTSRSAMQIQPSQPKRWRNEVGVLSSTLPVLLAVVFFLPPSASADGLTYDPYLNIYWMKDGNMQGLMTWDDAKEWAEQLTYGGYNDWRLPSTPDGYYKKNDDTIWDYYNSGSNSNDNKYNVTFSDLGSLYYNYFKLSANCSISTVKNSPFENLQAGYYWFETASSQPLSGQPAAWVFDFAFGTQFLNTTSSKAYAIAVRDAAPAPEPSTALLFLTGLLGLCRIQHHRN